MKYMRLFFLCIMLTSLVLIFQSCAHTGAFKQGLKLESTGNYEEALQAYLRDLTAKPNNTDSKIAVKRTAEKVVNAKLGKGDYYLGKKDYGSAYSYYNKARSYIDLLKNRGLYIDSGPEFERKYKDAKDKICQSLYSRGEAEFNKGKFSNAQLLFKQCWDIDQYYENVAERLKAAEYQAKLEKAESFYESGILSMRNADYRDAFYKFDSAMKLMGSGFKSVTKLMNDCLQKGRVEVAVIPSNRTSYREIVDSILYKTIENIIDRKSEFLRVMDRQNLDIIMREQKMGRWYELTPGSASHFGKNIGIAGVVILDVTYYRVENSPIQRSGIDVCFLTSHQNQYGGLYYTGSPVTVYECTQNRTLTIEISYQFIRIPSGEVLLSQTEKQSDSDYTHYLEFNGDKGRLAWNCPQPNNIYFPMWVMARIQEKFNMKSETEMLENSSRNFPGNIAHRVISCFDK